MVTGLLPWRKVLGTVLLLILPLQAALARDSYEDLLKQAIAAMGDGSALAAEAILNQWPEYQGRVAYDLLLSLAALEQQKFDKAQLGFRKLANRTLTGEPNVKPKVERVYAYLWQARQENGLALPLAAMHFAAMPRQQKLNINANRRIIGLPYIGDVVQWREFSTYLTSGEFAAQQSPGVLPRPKPRVEKDSSAASSGSAASLQQLMDVAQRALSNSKPTEAYQLLHAHEFEGAGNPQFDYLLGTAAVDAAKADEAIFVLLRVLAVQPNHAGARLELGRAYYSNGDHGAAQEAFKTVLKQSPPPEAKLLAERYLVVIDDYLKSQLRITTPFVVARIGFDSNVNGATSEAQPFAGIAGVPAAISAIALSDNSLETDAAYIAISVGTGTSRQLKPRYFLRTGMQFDMQSNRDAFFANTQSLKGFAQYEYRQGKQLLAAAIDGTRSYVGGDFNDNTIGVSLLAGQPLGKQWALNGQLRVANRSFATEKKVKDSDDYSLAINTSHYWGGNNRLTGTVGVIVQDIDARTEVNSKQVLGLQANLNFVAFRSVLFSFSTAAIRADYEAAIVGSQQREDDSYVLGLDVTRYSSFNPNLKWLFSVHGRKTGSSLDLYDSKGIKASVGVRYDFR